VSHYATPLLTATGRVLLVAAAVLVGLAQARAGAVTVVLRDAAGAAVPEAVVALAGPARGAAAELPLAVVDQRDRRFVPQVTVIQVGTEVSFPNSDAVSHHVYSFAQPNAFELPLYKGGARPKIRFEHPGVVVLGCNIHDAMLGYIVVVDTPAFGTTDRQGSITLADVPPGNYRVQAWSQRLDPGRMLEVGALDVGSQPLVQSLTVSRRLRTAPGGGGSLSDEDY
jgi:plastocyanin